MGGGRSPLIESLFPIAATTSFQPATHQQYTDRIFDSPVSPDHIVATKTVLKVSCCSVYRLTLIRFSVGCNRPTVRTSDLTGDSDPAAIHHAVDY